MVAVFLMCTNQNYIIHLLTQAFSLWKSPWDIFQRRKSVARSRMRCQRWLLCAFSEASKNLGEAWRGSFNIITDYLNMVTNSVSVHRKYVLRRSVQSSSVSHLRPKHSAVIMCTWLLSMSFFTLVSRHKKLQALDLRNPSKRKGAGKRDLECGLYWLSPCRHWFATSFLVLEEGCRKAILGVWPVLNACERQREGCGRGTGRYWRAVGGGRGGTEGLWEGDGEVLKGCGKGTGRNWRAVGGGRGGTKGLWEGDGEEGCCRDRRLRDALSSSSVAVYPGQHGTLPKTYRRFGKPPV